MAVGNHGAGGSPRDGRTPDGPDPGQRPVGRRARPVSFTDVPPAVPPRPAGSQVEVPPPEPVAPRVPRSGLPPRPAPPVPAADNGRPAGRAAAGRPAPLPFWTPPVSTAPPDWFAKRGGNGTAVFPAGTTRLVLEVDATDIELRPRSALVRFRQSVSAGAKGLGTSIAVHLVVALLLGMVVVARIVRTVTPGTGTLEFGWLSDAEMKRVIDSRKPVDLQAFTTPVAPKPAEQSPETTESKTESTGSEKTGPPADPVRVEQLFDGRGREQRTQTLEAAAGNSDTETALSLALNWLKRQQKPNGSWKLHEGYPDPGEYTLRSDSGATALVLLAFLGTGNTHRGGEHQDVVAGGLRFLLGSQKEDGDFHDHAEFGRRTSYYVHSQATIAVCEAYALTRDEALRAPAEKAVRFLLASQQPVQGGWKYQPQTVKTVGDLSVTGWALMALHSARAGGIAVPDDAFYRAGQFLDAVQEQGGSRYKYMPTDPPETVSLAMTAEGLLCRQYLGWPRDHGPMRSGLRFLLAEEQTPQWAPGLRNVYAWYYVAQTLHNAGGEEWLKWYRNVHQLLTSTQVRSGSRKGPTDVHGSWDPRKPLGAPHEYADLCGRLYFTTMCALILETPIRHRSIYAAEEAAPKP